MLLVIKATVNRSRRVDTHQGLPQSERTSGIDFEKQKFTVLRRSRGRFRVNSKLYRINSGLWQRARLFGKQAWFVRSPCIMIGGRGLVLRHVRGHVSESPKRVRLWHVAVPLALGTITPWETLSPSFCSTYLLERLFSKIIDTHRWMYVCIADIIAMI